MRTAERRHFHFPRSLTAYTAVAIMADTQDDVDVGMEENKNLSKEQAAEAKQLDAVTDFAEEAEMTVSGATQAVLSNLTASGPTDEQQRISRELAAVVVKQDDIDMLASELEITPDEAEKQLREARGDVKLALTKAIA